MFTNILKPITPFTMRTLTLNRIKPSSETNKIVCWNLRSLQPRINFLIHLVIHYFPEPETPPSSSKKLKTLFQFKFESFALPSSPINQSDSPTNSSIITKSTVPSNFSRHHKFFVFPSFLIITNQSKQSFKIFNQRIFDFINIPFIL